MDSALKAYKTRREAEMRGERPMHRPKGWKKDGREAEKLRKKKNWYKKEGNEAVIFVLQHLDRNCREGVRKRLKTRRWTVQH